MDWGGRIALITGASRGIGAAVARAAARKGARVALLARDSDDLDAVLESCGRNGLVVPCDVTDRNAVEDAVARATTELGPIDILVNNAGAGHFAKIVDAEPDVFERLMKLNYLGTVYATKALLPAMLARRSGHIVNVGSIVGRLAAPLEGAYSASKFAVSGFTDALWLEATPHGVGVSLIAPGPVATDFFRARGSDYARSFPKPVSAEDVARAVIRAVERNKAETFVPSWLGMPPALKTLMPPVFRRSTARSFRKELG
jgi:3-oxoacyl-[acyl-carrier protein] reductase